MGDKNKLGSPFDEQSYFDKDLMEKLREYKDDMNVRMSESLDNMIASNRETIRMKCLEAALKYCEMRFQLGDRFGDQEIMNIAEEFYKFVK